MRVKHWAGLAVGFCLCFAIYQLYPVVLYQVMEWQKSFNLSLSSSLRALQENEQQAGWGLVFISFLYGVFHAVGPGHGKFILTSYLSLEKTQLKQAMKISLSAAFVQGVVAISVVSIVVVVFTLSRSYFNLTLQWIERGSFALMFAFGAYWVVQALRQLKPKKVQFRQFTLLQNVEKTRPLTGQKAVAHIHNEHCGCGHQHLPNAAQMQHSQSWKSQAMLIFSIGSRPCSGAILVLFLAYTLGIYRWGVLSALAMAAGTGITLSAFAALVLLVRHKAVSLSQFYLSANASKRSVFLLKLLVGLVLMAMAVVLLHSSFLSISAPNTFFKR